MKGRLVKIAAVGLVGFFCCLLSLRAGALLGKYSGLRANAISRKDAMGAALAKVGNGEIKVCRMIRSHGQPVWEVEVVQPGAAGVVEVKVHAMTGEVVAAEFRSARQTREKHERLARQLEGQAEPPPPETKETGLKPDPDESEAPR